MMNRMRAAGVLPEEQGSAKGKTTVDSVMVKQLFFDQANILHVTCAKTNNVAESCYDAVNHTAASISLQAMGVPITHIVTYLACVHLMLFFLKTGFGLSNKGFGGTRVNPFQGLIQGSGAAPGAWTAVSTVILSVYKRRGYGAKFSAGWSGLIFTIAALLYVDDTDLLHMYWEPGMTEVEFVERVQRATYYWAMLLQATGGNLKDIKCY